MNYNSFKISKNNNEGININNKYRNSVSIGVNNEN